MMKVLSLFDGIACARAALDRAGFDVSDYLASEIDKYAIHIAYNNWKDIQHIGDVKNIGEMRGIDLLIGGSPCQDLSGASNNRKGLDGERSGLFREYVRILKESKPRYFVLENVASMTKENKDRMSEALGVQPIMIDAALVSAQRRRRLFRTNIPGVTQPEDRGILLRDILEDEVDEKYYVNITERYGLKGLSETKAKCLTASCHKGYGNDGVTTIRVGHIGKGGQGERVYSEEGKSVSLTSGSGGLGGKTGLYHIQQTARGYNKGGEHHEKSPTLTSSSRQENNKLVGEGRIRKLTPIECERLMGLPDGYTEGVSNTQRYKSLGNAFNVDVVAHILSFIPRE